MRTGWSDSRLSMAEVAKCYAERGYDFIYVTGHMVPFVGARSGNELPIMVLDGIELGETDDQSVNDVLIG